MKSHIILNKGIRKKAWIKNLLILYPLSFNFNYQNLQDVLFLFTSISCLASAVYIFNDYFDRSSDAKHPVKKYRIQVTDEFSLSDLAGAIMLLLTISLLFLIPIFSWKLLLLFSAYLSLNILYTVWLKHIKWIDVLCLSSFLFFRIASGSILLKSNLLWYEVILLLLLFLTLAILKRRIELSYFIQNKISLIGFSRPYTKDDLKI